MSTLLSVDWRVEGYSSHSFPLFFLPGFFFLDDVSDGLSLPRVFPAPVKTMAVPGRGWCHSKQLSEARGRLAVPERHWADPVGAGGAPGSHHGPPPVGTIWWLVWCGSPTSCVPCRPRWVHRAQVSGQSPLSMLRARVEQKPEHTDQRPCLHSKPSISS